MQELNNCCENEELVGAKTWQCFIGCGAVCFISGYSGLAIASASVVL